MAYAVLGGDPHRVSDIGTVTRYAHGTWQALTRAELLALPRSGAVWKWLRAQGVRRPSPSGATQAESKRARKGVLVRLSVDELADVDAYAEREGLNRSDAIVHAVRVAYSVR